MYNQRPSLPLGSNNFQTGLLVKESKKQLNTIIRNDFHFHGVLENEGKQEISHKVRR